MSKDNTATTGDDYTLAFADAPAAGAVIVVKRAAAKWADDDCHPASVAFPAFGRAVNAMLQDAAREAASKPGRR
jgi:hypothetical protein